MAAKGWCSGDGPRCDLRCCDTAEEKGLTFEKVIPTMPHMVHKSKLKYLPRSHADFIRAATLNGMTMQEAFINLFNVCFQKDLIDTKHEIYKGYFVQKFQASRISWLQVPNTNKTELEPIPGRKTNLKDYLTAAQKLFWEASAVLIPTYLPLMYHNVDVPALMKSQTGDMNCTIMSTWYATINESFGVGLMTIFNKKHTEFLHAISSTSVSKAMKSFRENFQNLLSGLKMSYCCPEIPHSSDVVCTTAQDFLLEPCILVQLPWKPVILQQWLLAGLAEVTIFEKESLEFRHWPLPANLKDCVCQLLALVRDLKSRIVLGFAIIGRMVHTHPESDPRFPQYILEKVVLPSVPVLKFLISGKALEIIKNVKNIPWAESNYEKQVSFIFVPESAYTIQNDLMHFYSQNYFNILSWIERKSSIPFPNPNFDIKEMIDQIENFKFLNEQTAPNKPASYEEEKLLEMLQSNLNHEPIVLDTKTHVKLISEFVKDTGRLPDLTAQKMQKKLLASKVYKKGDDIFQCKSESQFCIRLSMLSQEIITLRLIFEKEKGVLPQIISLQLQSLEQEQKIRLALTCSRLFKVGLKSSNKSKCDSVGVILEQIAAVQQEIDQQTYDLILSQYNQSWRKDVTMVTSPPTYQISSKTKLSNGKAISEMFIGRIGCLIYNVAKSNYEFFKNSDYVKSYPHWNIIQYILPCFVAGFLRSDNSCKKTPYKLKILELVHGVILFYEKSFLSYNPKIVTLSSMPSTLLKETDIQITNYYKAYGLLLSKYRDNIKLLLLTHSEEIDYYHWDPTDIDNVVKMIVSWPYHFSCFAVVEKSFLPCLESWFNFAYNYLVDLLKVFYDVWKPLKPGAAISRLPKLGELHLANAIISELESVFDIAVLNRRSRANKEDELEVRMQVCFCANEERLNINRNIAGIHNKSDDYLLYVVDHGKDIVGNLYEKLKKFRQTSGSILKFQLFDKLPHLNNPFIKNAVRHYINGNLDALDEMLTVFEIPFVRKCRQCLQVKDKLMACKKCVEQNYPDVNYYCSDKCQVAKWNSEHMDEHLEFELGIADLPEESS